MKKILVCLFVLIPLALSVMIFSTPDKAVSEYENRALKTKADITLENFNTETENFLSDQFLFREQIVRARSYISYCLGKRDINDVYIGDGGFVRKLTAKAVNLRALERKAEKINTLAESIDTYVMYVPSASTVNEKILPKFASMYDYPALFGALSAKLTNATVIDVGEALSGDGAYYKNDHHWTADGSFAAYEKWCEAHDITPKNFDFVPVTEDFYGTLYTKTLIDLYGADTIRVPVIADSLSVTADGDTISFYEETALETVGKYDYFQGGNHGIVKIENPAVKNGKVLLLIKDSFANSFVPYIVGDYEKIVMLDERYSHASPAELIEAEGVTELAVIREIIEGR